VACNKTGEKPKTCKSTSIGSVSPAPIHQNHDGNRLKQLMPLPFSHQFLFSFFFYPDGLPILLLIVCFLIYFFFAMSLFTLSALALYVLLSLISTFHSSSALSQDTRCYTLDSNLNADFPCFLEQNSSVCCLSGWACEASGLCRSPGSTDVSGLVRGSCTAKDWANGDTPECPPLCDGSYISSTIKY